MALFEEQITEKLESGAPNITYEGNEGKEQQIARELWDQLPPQAQQQFGNFQQFFSSGAWKEVLAQLQQAQAQQAQSQEGLGSMMPAQMADGGMLMASANDPLDDKDQIAHQLFGKGLHELTPDELIDLDEWLEDKAQKWGGADGGRPGYFLGKLVRKITKPIKKLVKSPIGKAAALAAGAYFAPTLFGGTAGFGKGSTWGNVLKGIRAKNLMGPLSTKGEQFGRTLANKALSPVGLGAIASLTPFAMQAAGKWDTGAEEIDNLKSQAAEFGFDYSQMIQDLQAAVATGSEAELAKVLSNYNLSRGDMSAAPYIGTAAEGGRIGYAEGGWEAREKQTLISKLVDMGLPLPQAMKMAEMIIANATPEELQRALAGPGSQGPSPLQATETIEENIITPRRRGDETRTLIERVKETGFPLQNLQPMKGEYMRGSMQRPEMEEEIEERDVHYGMGDNFRNFPPLVPKGWRKELLGRQDFNPVPIKRAEGGLMSLGGMEMDLRGGGFVPLGAQEKADDVPARLSKNEFVFTADAVRAAGGGDVDAGADKMYKTMKQLENRVG
jgi:hypothetical protein